MKQIGGDEPIRGGKQDKKPLTKEESAKVIEAAIRKAAKKPTGELTKADYEKVTKLILFRNQLTDTDVKVLEKLTQLTLLYLDSNQLTDVKGLEKLTQLENLSLNDNKLTDVREGPGEAHAVNDAGISMAIN